MSADTAALLGNAASARPSIVFRGKAYSVNYIDDDLKNAFELWLKAQAREEVLRWRELLPMAEYKIMQQAFVADVAAGKYAFDDFYARNAIDGNDGSVVFTSLVLGCDVGIARAILKERRDEVQLLLDEVWAVSYPEIKQKKDNEGGSEGNETRSTGSPPPGLTESASTPS